MPLYRYKTINQKGEITLHGGLFLSFFELHQTVMQEGKILLEAHPLQKRRGKKLSLLHQSIFLLHLARCFQQGLPLRKALESYHPPSKRVGVKKEILLQQLTEGINFSDALENVSFLTPSLINHVRIAEESGTLQASLKMLGENCKQRHTFQTQLRNALAYPIFLMNVLLFICLWLLPIFIEQSQDFLAHTASKKTIFPSSIPAPVLSIQHMTAWNGSFLLGIVLSLFLATRWIPSLKKKMTAVLFRFPLYPLWHTHQIFQALLIHQQAHQSLSLSIELQERWTQNRFIKEKLQKVFQQMTQGYSFVESLRACFPLPLLCQHLLKQGEETGTLSNAIQEVSTILCDTLHQQLQKIITWIQPFLLILIGVCLMGGVLTILGPLYEINGLAYE